MRINKSLITQTGTGGGGSGTVTSVDLSVSVPTGLSQSVTGNPITTSGTIAISLSFAAGYAIPTTVKQSEWDDAYTWVAAFPTQTGNAGKYLKTDGSNLMWTSLVSPAYGTTGQVQMNNGGDLYANADLYFDITNSRLGIGVGGTYIHKTLVVHSTTTNNQFLLSGTAPGIEFGDNTSGTFTYRSQIGMATSAGHFATNSVAGDLVHWVDTGSNMLWAINSVEKMKLLSTGQFKLAGYTTLTSFTGTAVGNLAFTSTGNIITVPSATINGTSNYVAKFTSQRSIVDSTIFDNGTFVGINTNTSGFAKFIVYSSTVDNHIQVVGTGPSIRLTDTHTSATVNGVISMAAGTGQFIANSAAGDMVMALQTTGSLIFGFSSAECLRIFKTTGNVSINGNATDNGYKFECQGTSNFTNNLRVVPVGGGELLLGLSNYVLRFRDNGNYTRFEINQNGVGNNTTLIGGGLLGAVNISMGTTGMNFGFPNSTNTSTYNFNRVFQGNINSTARTLFDINTTHNTALSNATKLTAFYVRPTATDWVNLIAWENTVGNMLMGTTSGSVGIGANTTINASAILDITSTNKGFLPPRMTGAQAEAITTPAAGLMVYANSGNGTTITSIGWWGYDGSAWVKLN